MKEYILSKKIFVSIFLIGCIAAGTVIYIEGMTNPLKKSVNVKCEEEYKCKNPLYDEYCEDPNCQSEFVEPGEMIYTGQQKSKLINYFNYGVWVMILAGIILNHLLFNRGYPLRKRIDKIISSIEIKD